MQEEYPIWRLVSARVATLSEIEQHWDWEDIDLANAVLDNKEDVGEAFRLMLEANPPKTTGT